MLMRRRTEKALIWVHCCILQGNEGEHSRRSTAEMCNQQCVSTSAMELWSSMRMPDFCQEALKMLWGLNTMEESCKDIGNLKQITLSIIKDSYIILWAQRDSKYISLGQTINKLLQQCLRHCWFWKGNKILLGFCFFKRNGILKVEECGPYWDNQGEGRAAGIQWYVQRAQGGESGKGNWGKPEQKDVGCLSQELVRLQAQWGVNLRTVYT